MRRINYILIGLALLIIVLLSAPALAKVGVGINLGKISVNQPLYAGGQYNLAKMSVINTGTESGEYKLSISYLEGQKKLKPDEAWFKFTPKKFFLKPGEAKQVDIEMLLPIDATAGKYFAFVEGRPVAKKKGMAIGVAAAAKLTFSVKSSSLFYAIINRLKAIILNLAPYSYIFFGLLALVLAILLTRRYVNVSFSLRKRDNKK